MRTARIALYDEAPDPEVGVLLLFEDGTPAGVVMEKED